MLFDILVLFLLFLFSYNWFIFFILSFFFKVFKFIDYEVNNVIASDNFISNDMEADENTSPYKYNSLNDSFKAFDESDYGSNVLISKSYKFLKKFVSYPLEVVYSKSLIIYVPQMYQRVDKELKKRCILGFLYIWNLNCSNKLKMKMTSYLMQSYMKMMMQNANNSTRPRQQQPTQPMAQSIDHLD